MLFSKSFCGFFVALLQLTNALHYYTHSADTRCFYEELTKGTLLVGKLAAGVQLGGDDFIGDPRLKLEITVDETFDNDHRVVAQKSPSEADFTFSVLDSGEHKLCITPTFPDRNAKVRVTFDTLLAGGEVIDSQRKDDVSLIKNKVKELSNKLEEVKREQLLIRERESTFRDQSETTNSKVVRWSIIQLVVLLATGAWQMRHLKTFFIKQKVL